MSKIKGSLTLVGSGIKFFSHLTLESKIHIEGSDQVLYLVNEPAMKDWIKDANPNSISLDMIYNQFPLREDCYLKITEFILEKLRFCINICVVIYGHPTVYSRPGLDAVHKAKAEGFPTKIFPGISAEACLFADLLIDPGSSGCQSFEATDFLIHKKKFDTCCHIILWQVDVIGATTNPKNYINKTGIRILKEHLEQVYPSHHRLVLYEAAQYPGLEPKIQDFALGEMLSMKFSSITMLYIPPLEKPKIDLSVIEKLKLKRK